MFCYRNLGLMLQVCDSAERKVGVCDRDLYPIDRTDPPRA